MNRTGYGKWRSAIWRWNPWRRRNSFAKQNWNAACPQRGLLPARHRFLVQWNCRLQCQKR
jgi:hypothetical protein